MLNDRRKFMISTGMAAGATILGQLSADEKFTEGETPEGDISELVSRYGKVLNLSGGSGGVVHISAQIRSHQRMAKILTAQHQFPFEQIRVTSKQALELTHRGKRFLISHQA